MVTGTGLAKVTKAGQLADVQRIGALLADYLAASVAPATVKAYRSDWAHFSAWCAAHEVAPLPAAPEVVALYLADLAETHTPATLTRRVSAIAGAHRAAGHESPTAEAVVRKALAGIRRQKGTAADAKAPVTVADLQAITRDHLPDGAKCTRDRALLLVGFAGAFRRSELVGIDREHVEFVGEGVVVTLPRSKTDQEGAGRRVAIPYGQHPDTCPVLALATWCETAHIESGPVFRAVDRWGRVSGERLTDRGAALVVKHYMGALGKDARTYSGHSLRAGFATAAARSGAAERDIMRQTGHKSEAMVRRYIRDGNLFRANAAATLGL